MEKWILFISLALLLVGVFVLKRLWLGCLSAIVLFIISKSIGHTSFDYIEIPMMSTLVISFELCLLLFGAYLFYRSLDANDHFAPFTARMSALSSRLHIIIILCYFLGSFMEGIAGFGIPAMLIAPLLITFGFRPLTSIVLPLAANTLAVTFGALGTPLKIGLNIYDTNPTVLLILFLNLLPAILLPFMLAYLYGKTEQTNIDWRKNSKTLLIAGIAFAIPYFATGFLSIEFPSVTGGLMGLWLFFLILPSEQKSPDLLFWLKTFYPYLIFISMLLMAKYTLSFYGFNFKNGARSLSLYQPGFVFIMACLAYLILKKRKGFVQSFLQLSKETSSNTIKLLASICLLVLLTQLIQHDLSGIIQQQFVHFNETLSLLTAPFIGLLGSFVSGSATMSNLMLGSSIVVKEISENHLALLFALLHTGSAIGNALSLQNILMLQSVVQQSSIGYAEIIKLNLKIIGIYIILVVLMALFLFFFML